MMAISKKRTSTRVLLKEITIKMKTPRFEVDVWRAETLQLYYQYYGYPGSLWVTNTSDRSRLKGANHCIWIPMVSRPRCHDLEPIAAFSQPMPLTRVKSILWEGFVVYLVWGFVFLSYGSFFLLTMSIFETILVFSIHSSLSQVHISLDDVLSLW